MQELKQQAAACTERARTLARHPDFAKRPPAGWSAAECLDHLCYSSAELVPPIEAAIPTAGASARPCHMTWRERTLIWFLEPPYRMKIATKGAFEPAVSDPGAVLSGFEQWQQRLGRALDIAGGKALDQVRIQSPFNADMHYSAWAALHILLAHQRRHLWQAEQVLSRFRV